MKTLSTVLAVAVLGASLGSALADTVNPNSALVSITEATRVSQPIVEGRQAATVAPSVGLTDAERAVVERNFPR
ncbi:hypothetical protein EYW49_17225 [Siculibacillus lacustris]|uniref:DUF4148 domain-containing protein n=1 Tax=Siculibacillus lacustris TaxID=1549641 RepID=A0A4Q9VIB2_9HYPH|nr:hypothetical protein [Siculibacillus lacustris]TBW34841.1 hypothetical protein EYW49_17225 [Siculibacillus lacustris]